MGDAIQLLLENWYMFRITAIYALSGLFLLGLYAFVIAREYFS